MRRYLYRYLLWLHPPAFRRRFGEEMLCIFDESAPVHGVAFLLADALGSLIRQWVTHPLTWKVAVACLAAVLEIAIAGWPMLGPRR